VDKDRPANRAVPAADGSRASAPYLRVVHGDATPEEVAALVAALAAVAAARTSAGHARQATQASGWTDRTRLLRPAVHPGPGGWRRSVLPGG
jgi:hypothetical protein